MEGHKGRKETTAKKRKETGDPAGGLCGIHQGVEKGIGRKRERRRWREGKRGGGEASARGIIGLPGLSEGFIGLPLNAKGPAGAQRGPTEQAAQRATAGVGAP